MNSILYGCLAKEKDTAFIEFWALWANEVYILLYMKEITKQTRGIFGEDKVKKVLDAMIKDGEEQYYFENIVLPIGIERTTQIDFVLLRPNGLFCIECKNYSGFLFGRAAGDEWTLCNNAMRQKVPNALKQNNLHIYGLGRLVKERTYINSLVVMVQNNSKRVEAHNVIDLNNLRDYLVNFDNDCAIPKETMEQLLRELGACPKGSIEEKQHAQKVKTRRELIARKICPVCGGRLIERKGKGYLFYGCRNFPMCTFISRIRPLTEEENEEYLMHYGRKKSR